MLRVFDTPGMLPITGLLLEASRQRLGKLGDSQQNPGRDERKFFRVGERPDDVGGVTPDIATATVGQAQRQPTRTAIRDHRPDVERASI